MSKPKKPLTWWQIEEFIQNLPEEKKSCPVVVWGEERGFTIQGVEQLKEEWRLTD